MMTATFGPGRSPRVARTLFRVSRALREMLRLKLTIVEGSKEFVFYPAHGIEFRRYLTYFTKEEGTLAWLRSTLQKGDVFFDVGANIGLYSIYAAKLGRGVKVYAFEPHKFNFVNLIDNVSRNGLLNEVSPVAIPLGSTSGVVELNYLALDTGTSHSQLGHKTQPDHTNFTPKFEEIVFAMPVDDLVASKAVRPPDVVKIDVDGNEMSILEGMKQTLSGPSRPRSIQVEANKGQKSELQRFMSEHGYKVDHAHFTRRGKQLKSQGVPEDQIAHNVVFVPA